MKAMKAAGACANTETARSSGTGSWPARGEATSVRPRCTNICLRRTAPARARSSIERPQRSAAETGHGDPVGRFAQWSGFHGRRRQDRRRHHHVCLERKYEAVSRVAKVHHVGHRTACRSGNGWLCRTVCIRPSARTPNSGAILITAISFAGPERVSNPFSFVTVGRVIGHPRELAEYIDNSGRSRLATISQNVYLSPPITSNVRSSAKHDESGGQIWTPWNYEPDA